MWRSSKSEIVVVDVFDSGQGFDDADHGQVRQTEQILALNEVREQMDDTRLRPHFCDCVENGYKRSFSGGVSEDEILLTGFFDRDDEFRDAVLLRHGAYELRPLVQRMHRPVVASSLKSDRKDVRFCVESFKLMRKELADILEYHGSNT